MKTINIIITVVLVAISAISCNKEQTFNSNSGKRITFSASFPNLEQQEKTYLSDGNVVNWRSGDSFSVNNETGESNNKGNLFTNSETNVNLFTGILPGEKENYYALYPYSALVSWKPTASKYFPAGVSFILPNKQTATKGSFDPSAGIVYGQATSEKSFVFTHVPGYLKFSITAASGSIKSVKVSAKNGMSGQLVIRTLTENDGGYAGIEESGSEYMDVTLSTPDNSAMEVGDYYIALRARKYIGGLNFTFTNTDDQIAKKELAVDTAKVVRGTVYNIGSVAGLDFKSPENKKIGMVENGGIISYSCSDYYLLMSIDQGECFWTTNSAYAVSYGTTSGNDGSVNTDKLLKWINDNNASMDDFPALKWVCDHGDGWYLPSQNELSTMYSAINASGENAVSSWTVFNDAISNAGGNTFDYCPTADWVLWSSNESNATQMKALKVIAGGSTGNSTPKKFATGPTTRSVRAVKKISIE